MREEGLVTSRVADARRRDPAARRAWRVANAAKWRDHWNTRDPYAVGGKRLCRRCDTSKPVTEFALNRTTKSGLQTTCKTCGVRRWQEKRYGRAMPTSAACAICRVASNLHLDHCHDSGEFRGVLCHHCNALLGFARDDVTILSAAIEYLREHNASRERMA